MNLLWSHMRNTKKEAIGMSKENEQFLSLYKTYEGLLRQRGADYRVIEEEQSKQGIGRMTIMRQMRNYLCHAEDPGFLTISQTCIKALEKMVKEEQLKGDIVKNHLITPAKGSLKEGTPLSQVVYRMSKLAMTGIYSMPVYNEETKRLKGMVLLERMAYELDRKGNIPLEESTCGAYGQYMTIVAPETQASHIAPMPFTDSTYILCTKDGTLDSQYLGYLDK